MNDLHVCIINKCKYVIVIFIYECTHVCLCTKQKKIPSCELSQILHIFLPALKKESEWFRGVKSAKVYWATFTHWFGDFCSLGMYCTLILVSHMLILSTPMRKWKSCIWIIDPVLGSCILTVNQCVLFKHIVNVSVLYCWSESFQSFPNSPIIPFFHIVRFRSTSCKCTNNFQKCQLHGF